MTLGNGQINRPSVGMEDSPNTICLLDNDYSDLKFVTTIEGLAKIESDFGNSLKPVTIVPHVGLWLVCYNHFAFFVDSNETRVDCSLERSASTMW